MILLITILIYFFTVFVILRLIVPYYGFKTSPLPNKIPQSFQAIIDSLNHKSIDNYDYLRKSYDYITDHYYGSRTDTLLKFWMAFQNPFKYDRGFMPCNTLNTLLKIMLIRSNRFKNSQIRTRVVFLNCFIHQFLEVKINDKWIQVDPSYKVYGIPFGRAAIGFK